MHASTAPLPRPRLTLIGSDDGARIRAIDDGRPVADISIVCVDSHSQDAACASIYEGRLRIDGTPARGTLVTAALLFAALRSVEAAGGRHLRVVVPRARRAIAGAFGLADLGRTDANECVDAAWMHCSAAEMRRRLLSRPGLLARIERAVDWRIDVPFHKSSVCYHGGAFFKAVGEDLRDLDRRHDVIHADVLDAWFPPAPEVMKRLRRDLDWLVRTSPPTSCDGLIDTIAAVRGIDRRCLVPGAGSSDLIFRALRQWLSPESRVLLLDPTYGEYAHVLERVIGCRVDRFSVGRDDEYTIDPDGLAQAVRLGCYDLVILVNPNSPTGRHLPRDTLEHVLRRIPRRTLMWIDETYVEYVGRSESLERTATQRTNAVVCKSMSKVYALSGMRAAYLCGPRHLMDALRTITPPWVIGLPSQLAAIAALDNPAYYERRYRQTHRLRAELAAALRRIGIDVLPGSVANFLLCELDPAGPDAKSVVARCREDNVFLRDAGRMGCTLGPRTLRIAVKNAPDNARIAETLSRALNIAAADRPRPHDACRLRPH